MTEQVLDVPDVHSLLQQESGDGVSEHMGCEVEGKAGVGSVPTEHETDRLLRETTAKPILEEEGLHRCSG